MCPMRTSGKLPVKRFRSRVTEKRGDYPIGMSNAKCRSCQGSGYTGRRVCWCVWRGVFSAVYHRYQTGIYDYRPMTTEYRADFMATARRMLSVAEYRVFHLYFIALKDFRYCLPRVGLDRGQFFHMVYRIMAILGQEFYSSKPYGMFPVDEYFTQRKTYHLYASRSVGAPILRWSDGETGNLTPTGSM